MFLSYTENRFQGISGLASRFCVSSSYPGLSVSRKAFTLVVQNVDSSSRAVVPSRRPGARQPGSLSREAQVTAFTATRDAVPAVLMSKYSKRGELA